MSEQTEAALTDQQLDDIDARAQAALHCAQTEQPT